MDLKDLIERVSWKQFEKIFLREFYQKVFIKSTWNFVLEVKPSSLVNEKNRGDSSKERKPKEAPSDPRRRRRISESSSSSSTTTKKEVPQPTTPKKSPRNEEPPNKLRKSDNRNTMNAITRKSHSCWLQSGLESFTLLKTMRKLADSSKS